MDKSDKRIDLNCDIGEGFGVYRTGEDERLLDVVTSANIACGFHAGDPATMLRTVRLCAERGVAIGAHPGLPDMTGFGRREMAISPQEAYEMTVYQLGALYGFVRAEGAVMRHVKPHGALYNMAAADAGLAEAIAEAVRRVDAALVLVGLAGSELVRAGAAAGLATAAEAFADRRYRQDGTLVPRREPGAMIGDAAEAVGQVLRLAAAGQAQTVCVHGDGPHALEFASRVRQGLQQAGWRLAPVAGEA
ncbi:LamB/YcsF family protein [Paenibacillus hemerocallicola]|uniref:5-oxoprolinase subunit A n=1 Tax=Paenibacillus hemerocallicola TaxID=1172614 RepID=A0A5C4T989_9BACL|nr:5-oxoprolinase subunit PxpA [Paenibacillus hemerocallicola]TNJ64977.1 LamB/YcsF family protein [Paenibacillus hemerocallicola]